MEMTVVFESSVFFGVFISLASYTFGVWLKKRTGWDLANPLLVALLFHFDHAAYVTFLPKSITTAIGTASHAVGTAKAMEMGAVEGAMSSLSIVVSGVLTVAGASIFAMFL